MSTVEAIALRLAAIHDELGALPDGPSQRRYELLKERDALRATAATFKSEIHQSRSSDELKSELDALRRQRKSLIESRAGYVMGKGGNSAGPASEAWVALSKQSQAASGIQQLNVRISQIEDELVARSRMDGGPTPHE